MKSLLTIFPIAAVCLLVSASVPLGAQARVGSLWGLVTDAANGTPIAGAEVSIPSLGKQTTTDEQGEFQLRELTPGPQELRVRRIGFQEFIAQVTIPDRGVTDRRIAMRRVQTLTPVEVSADPVMADFEENRRIGLGKFMTRAEIEKLEHLKLADILGERGIKTFHRGRGAWVGGHRGPTSMGNAKCVKLENGPTDCRCFAQVYLNGALLYNGEPSGIVPDIQTIFPHSIEAIEYYASAAQTPMKYGRLNSQCGVLVLHTRRTPGKVAKP